MQPRQSSANWAWWCVPTTLALRKPKQEDGETEASLDHIGTCQTTTTTEKEWKACGTVKPSWGSQVLYVLCKLKHMGYFFSANECY